MKITFSGHSDDIASRRRYEMSGAVPVESAVEADSPHDAVRMFLEEHGTLPDEVDGVEVEGLCEGCETVLLDGDRYHLDEDGCYICGQCLDVFERASDSAALGEEPDPT